MAFRIRHDCPIARVSGDVPQAPLRAWMGHRSEVVQARAPTAAQDEVVAALGKHMPNASVVRYRGGVVAINEAAWPHEESITRQLEKHGALWIQPLQYREGWEAYEVVSTDDPSLQEYLKGLLARYTLEVTSRGAVDEKTLVSAFFVPLNPILARLTEKQEEALLAAYEHGYYEEPRGTTTRDVAASMGISRSAYEERLRKAENLVVSGVAPSLAAAEKPGRSGRRTALAGH